MYKENQPMFLIDVKNFEYLLRKIVSEEIEILSKKINKAPKLLTRDQAAKALNVCPNTISEWVKTGRLENRGIGRKILLQDTDLDGLAARTYTRYKKTA